LVGRRLTRRPAHEALLDAFEDPEVVVLVANADVRPGPEQPAMMMVILREVVGEHLAIEAVSDARAGGRDRRAHRLVDGAVVVNEHGPVALEQGE
jgi:hypothetical protein